MNICTAFTISAVILFSALTDTFQCYVEGIGSVNNTVTTTVNSVGAAAMNSNATLDLQSLEKNAEDQRLVLDGPKNPSQALSTRRPRKVLSRLPKSRTTKAAALVASFAGLVIVAIKVWKCRKLWLKGGSGTNTEGNTRRRLAEEEPTDEECVRRLCSDPFSTLVLRR
ncbi:hypothetical protein TGPRC2_306870 [Toxoplasma gondii TgCatPRC2]|uniref:Transmembrane protein n=1 Tax=Toxoplasma gondii TgCatPRC2 TaxID=1130821 RepID=A0A151GZR6_TOXGO|nr:hypothetical protein TGPRC2_306870 [Toxoplasma gondii TgCatPRC2]